MIMGCPYLRYDESHCAGCRGWYCAAFGRKKKMSDISICQSEEEWLECPRYMDASSGKSSGIGVLGAPKPKVIIERVSRANPIPTPNLPPGCEYMGIPPGGPACCFVWCYADNRAIRSTKICRHKPSKSECRYFIQAKRRGVKPYNASD